MTIYCHTAKKIEHLLSVLNLSSKEIKIYIFLLYHGSQAGSVIAKHIKISRTTIYHTLNKLQKKGFIVSFKKNNITFFSISNLDRVIYMINTQKSVINIQSDAISKILEIEAKISSGKKF